MGKAKETILGVLALILILIGGTFYSDILGGLWYSFIQWFSKIF